MGKGIFIFCFFLLMFIYKGGLSLFTSSPPQPNRYSPSSLSNNHSTNTDVVIRIVDGDTVVFTNASGKNVKGRFIAVDTPETKHPKKGIEPFGPEATLFTTNWINTHHEYVEYINKYDDSDSKDNYQRYLIWITDGNSVLNIELVRAGLAKVKLYGYKNLKYEAELLAAENYAKRAKLGIWSK